MVNQYIQELALQNPPQLLLNVDGVARSRKTFTLLKTCSQVWELALEDRKQNPIFRAAPTSIAAFNINRRTLHSLLQLLVKDRKAELSTATLQSLQALFQNCRFLIIDEKSMINIHTLSLINDRLWAIFPSTSYLPFRSVNILLCRDFFQLLPVGGKPLFSRTHLDVDALKGQQLYQAFDRTVRLTKVI